MPKSRIMVMAGGPSSTAAVVAALIAMGAQVEMAVPDDFGPNQKFDLNALKLVHWAPLKVVADGPAYGPVKKGRGGKVRKYSTF